MVFVLPGFPMRYNRRMKNSSSLILVAFLGVLLGLPAMTHAQTAGTLTITPSSVTMYVGESKVVYASGASSYYIGTNANPTVASGIVNGSSVIVNGITVGTNNISICTSANGTVSCGSFGVTVQKNPNAAVAAQQSISFSKKEVTVNIGESQSVTVTGSTADSSFYISTLNDAEIVYASLTGNILSIRGTKIGGTNITVCQFGGTCGNVYAYVPSSNANTQAAQAVASSTSSAVPGLSAFYIASSGANFLDRGAVLTIKFNTTIDVSRQSLKIAGHEVPATGAGSGPYAGSYTMTGVEPAPLPVSIDFSTAQGVSGHAYFTIGGTGPTIAPTPSPVANSAQTFTNYLHSGSTNGEVSALQTLLKKLGVYDGPVTGKFGALTEAAVKKYQAKKGLQQLGVVGPATRVELNKEQ